MTLSAIDTRVNSADEPLLFIDKLRRPTQRYYRSVPITLKHKTQATSATGDIAAGLPWSSEPDP